MRTTLNLNDELIRDAQKITRLTEKTAVVHAGLKALIAREAATRLAEVSFPNYETFGPASEQHTGSTLVDRPACRANAFHRQVELDERVGRIAGGIFNGESRDSRAGGGGHVRTDLVRGDGESAFEVGIHRNLHAPADEPEVRQHLVERNLIVPPSERPGETRARGGERGKPELGEQARAPQIPGVRDDEAAGFVEPAKALALRGGLGHPLATL